MNRIAIAIFVASVGLAQDARIKLDLSKLAAKATNTVDVNLDGAMLEMGSKFLSGEKADEAKIKKLVSGLKGIYVKSFEFDKEGQYSQADVEAIRAQVTGPGWKSIMEEHGKTENTGVYVKTDGKNILGLVVLAAEPKEFTVVNIVGPIDPDSLSELSGKMGIPTMSIGPVGARKKKDD